MTALTLFFVFAFGLILGSFFNVLIRRLPRNESIVRPGSHCPHCSRPIRPHENIPVLSYVLLRGACAGCGGPISPQYPAIELLSGVASLIVWLCATDALSSTSPDSHRDVVSMAVQGLALLFLIPVGVIDIYHYIIPDGLSLGGLALGLALSFLPGGLTPLQSLLGVAAGGGSLLALGKVGELLFKKPDAMGGGDIKLMAAVGALWGWKVALLSIMFGSVLGAAVGVSLMLVKALRQDRKIPFCPFLALGTWVAALRGDAIVQWYLTTVEQALMP